MDPAAWTPRSASPIRYSRTSQRLRGRETRRCVLCSVGARTRRLRPEMKRFAGWPKLLKQRVLDEYGPPVTFEPLGGMSRGCVCRVRFAGNRSAILKTSPHPQETLFYEKVSGILNDKGIPTPKPEWTGRDAYRYWLLLEDVPQPLPRDRWLADSRVMELMRRLHALEHPDDRIDLTGAFSPRWTDRTTELAASCFPDNVSGEIRKDLRGLQRESQHLFRPQCYISGDPNPTNWALRKDDTLVLYDWERFGSGSPALDLAVTIPGLGNDAEFVRVAARYAEQAIEGISLPRLSAESLSQDIRLAKAWSVTELLSRHAEDALIGADDVVEWLVSSFPDWLRSFG